MLWCCGVTKFGDGRRCCFAVAQVRMKVGFWRAGPRSLAHGVREGATRIGLADMCFAFTYRRPTLPLTPR